MLNMVLRLRMGCNGVSTISHALKVMNLNECDSERLKHTKQCM